MLSTGITGLVLNVGIVGCGFRGFLQLDLGNVGCVLGAGGGSGNCESSS